MTSPEPVVLEGARVRLEPLGVHHLEPLLTAATEDRSHYQWSFIPGDREELVAYLDHVLDEQRQGLALPFATVDRQNNRVVGSTRFYSIERWTPRRGNAAPRPVARVADAVEIGWTWLSASAQRTRINTEAKLLMLTHAFEVWGVHRVRWETDVRNERSRAAIARLGAKLDGVLRAHRAAVDGRIRDSAFFSMIAAEWPTAKEALLHRLDRG